MMITPINTTTQILITNYEKLNDDLLTRLKIGLLIIML